jgi:hypothetical protein
MSLTWEALSMESFIDVSYIASDDTHTYLVVVFENGAVQDMLEHEEVTAVVNYCKLHDLPVMSDNPQVREILAAYGIDSRPFAYRVVGR